MRQRSNIAVQRDTATILNAKAYLESYADYLEDLNPSNTEEKTEIENIRDNGVNFSDITGSFTNEIDEIIGIVDFGESTAYKFSGDIYVEWNKCSDSSVGDLYVGTTLYESTGGTCSEGEDYNDIIGPISIANPEISTLNNPFEYRITAKDSNTTLKDNNWYIDLEIDLGYGEKVKQSRTITPKT